MSDNEMVELVARAIAESPAFGVSLAFTDPTDTDTKTILKCRIDDTARALELAREAIKTMREHLLSLDGVPRWHIYADGDVVPDPGDGEWIRASDLDEILKDTP